MHSRQTIPDIADTHAVIATHAACDPAGAQDRCLTCADEALEARVLHFDAPSGTALVVVGGLADEVDATLVGDLAPDDLVLVHGGVAIAKLP
jgi:hypothetical protein